MKTSMSFKMVFALTLLYLFLAFGWRTFQVWRRTGVNPYVLPADDSPQGYVGAAMRASMITLLLTTGLLAFMPQADRLLGTLGWLRHPVIQGMGWLLMMGGLGLTLVAQAHMGASWRIGLDEGARTNLVQDGVYARSRNPIFLAMRLYLPGVVLTAPNALTLTLLVAGELLMQLQVRLEEAYLQGVHGDSYGVYCARVPRWL